MNHQLLSEIIRAIDRSPEKARRVMYALDKRVSLPGPDEHAVRYGYAELPEGARVTERDKRIARRSQLIPEPKSRDDLPRYIAQLHVDDLYNNVMEKIEALAKDSPGNNVYNWTLGKHLGHEAAINTLGKYYVLDWPKARLEIHKNAIRKTINEKAKVNPGEQKNFVLLMGSPGSGKSTYGTRFAKDYIHKNFSEINPDLTREYLSEYQGHNEAGTHRESQLLTFSPMMNQAYHNHHHIILNVPGSDKDQMEGELTRARNHGYKTHLVYVEKDPYSAIGGTWKRFQINAYGAKDPTQKPSRFVLTSYTMGIAEKPKKTYEGLKSSGLLDTFVSIEPPVVYNKNGEGYTTKEGSHVRKRI